jgi:exodeoxyribonuclease V beta subunit
MRAVASPLADLPAGTAFGTFVHAVLERVCPDAPDLSAQVRTTVAAVGTAALTDLPPTDVADALLPLFTTPLGPVADNRTLADIGARDRLAELSFDLPLTGGPATTFEAIACLLRAHLPADDVFAAYADRLIDGSVNALTPLAGYLTGSIDAVLRMRGPAPRFVVVDYKTNRLGAFDEPLTCWHYRPAALVNAMIAAHYPLQLLLYSTALHRLLRWRLPGYDPHTHLGGALYLFVRGMAGPRTPLVEGIPCGVLSWRPPPSLVVALSDLLAAGPS